MSSRAGFTLLECVVAMLIVGTAAVAGLEMAGSYLSSSRKAEAALVRAALLQDRLARLQLLDHDQLEHLPDSARAGDAGPLWHGLEWSASVSGDRAIRGLILLKVRVTGPVGTAESAALIWRSPPNRGRQTD